MTLDYTTHPSLPLLTDSTMSNRGGKSSGTPSRKNSSNNNSSNTKVTNKDTKKDKKASNSICYDACPCGKSDKSAWMLTCTNCPQSWHNKCSNLKGISENFVTDLEDWLCPLCFHAPGVTNRSNQQMELVLDNMVEVREINVELQKRVSLLEDKLTSLISESDQVKSTNEELGKKLCTLKDIEMHIQHSVIQQSQVEAKLKKTSSDFLALQSSIESFKMPQPDHSAVPQGPFMSMPDPDPTTEPSASPKEVHACISDDFVDESTSTSITNFLNTCSFNNENGHSVVLYGHPYSYTGSKSSTNVPPVPSSIHPILDKLNEIQAKEFYDKYPHLLAQGCAPVLNSCLVNRYEGPDSYLSEHSDDEITIHPESSIFTISLGNSCEVKFNDKTGKGDNHSLTCEARSMYQMTLKSHDLFTHRTEKGDIGDGVRYSLTFRCVNWKNRNSTCIIGDSNTGKLNFGTSKLNSFSELMPGQCFWAATVEDVDSQAACAYNNVVVSVGINNLKQRDIRCQADIDRVYHAYKLKIQSIRALNRKANIFIVPVMPTKDHDLNNRAINFNKLLFNDLERSGLGVTHVVGLDDFVDSNNGLLSMRLSKHVDNNGRQDVLHLGPAGVRRFAGLIKRAIFLKLNKGVDKRKGIRTPDGTQRSPPRQVAGPVGADGYQS